MAEVSRDIGWDMRNMFTGRDTFLEYYTIVRRLRFERFLANFREHLIDQLNTYLISIGEAVGETGQLVVSGLPTETDIAAAEISAAATETSRRSSSRSPPADQRLIRWFLDRLTSLSQPD